MSDDDALNKQMKKKRFTFDLNYLSCFNNQSTINLTFEVWCSDCFQFFYYYFLVALIKFHFSNRLNRIIVRCAATQKINAI